MSESPAQQRQRERREQRDQRRVQAIQRQRRRRQLQLLGGVVALAVAAAAILILLNRPATSGGELAIVASPIPVGVATDGRRLGDPMAPVTIIEYGDYQCPYCGIFAREELPRLIDEFIAPGQASFEYRDLAFLGQESIDAAEAATCADDQGAFWPMHKTIYANQAGENRGAFAPDRLRALAAELGLDMAEFDACMERDTHLAEVSTMSDEARNRGINSTPTFVINDQVVPNAGYDNLRTTINGALEQ
jgi:protein-disulfide isomerase